MRFINLIGKRFGRLVVIEQIGKNKHGHILWLCRCDCGQEKIIRGGHLRDNKIKSCGCLNAELSSRRNTSHGCSLTPIYHIWRSMNDRCNNPNDRGYHKYGERRIKVCWRWSNKNPTGFENFYEDVDNPPEGLTLDRINNNGNYEPGNWRWATPKEQSRNTRRNHLLPINGKEKCLAECSEIIGIKSATIRSRIKRGWPKEKALTFPVRRRNNIK